MSQFKPVSISKSGFAFCRVIIATLIWLSIILQNTEILFIVFLILIFSATLKVEKAPLILLYKYTVERFVKSENIIVDEKGIYLSHIIGAIFSWICILLQYFGDLTLALIFTFAFAVLQTSAACGFCSVLKLYTCLNNGTCCRVGKFAKKVKNND